MTADDDSNAVKKVTQLRPSDPYLSDVDPMAREEPAFVFVGSLGGSEALAKAFPGGGIVGDDGPAGTNATLYFGGLVQGVEQITANHGIDALMLRATPVWSVFDIIYMRGAKLSHEVQDALSTTDEFKKALNSENPGDALFELCWGAYEKARGPLPQERDAGGFYVVTASYGVPLWDVAKDVTRVTGVQIDEHPNVTPIHKKLRDNAAGACNCPGCIDFRNNAAKMKSRFAPIPLLDSDRRMVRGLEAASPVEPTTAEPKLAEAIQRSVHLHPASLSNLLN